MPVVDHAVAAGDAEPEIGLVPDDSNLLRRVESLLDPLHLLALRVPVEEDGAEEEVLERLDAHARFLGHGGSRVTAGDPGDLEREPAGDEGAGSPRDRVLTICIQLDSLSRVLRRADADPRLALVLDRHADRRALRDQLGRRLFGPDGLEGPEIQAAEAELDDRNRAAAADRADDLLHERPRVRAAHDDYLPAGLDVDAALDQELCVVDDSRIRHLL